MSGRQEPLVHTLLPLGQRSPWLCREHLCLPGWGQSERSCVQVPARVMCTRGTLDLSHRYLRAQHLPAARLLWGGSGRQVTCCSSSSCCYQRCQRAPAGWAVLLPWLKSRMDAKNPSISLAEKRLGRSLRVNVRAQEKAAWRSVWSLTRSARSLQQLWCAGGCAQPPPPHASLCQVVPGLRMSADVLPPPCLAGSSLSP